MDPKPLWSMTAAELISLNRAGKCSAEDITRSCIARIEQREPVVRAFVDFDPTGAIRQAKALDVRGSSGPLHGIPVAVKDSVDVAGMHCTMGTPIHSDRIATGDAAVVARVRRAGAVIIGTTVSTEYCIARAGPTTNPHGPGHTPGGSSSGSAAAVGACMVPLAVATQTVGSIIRPSTYCGIFGLKPGKGVISRAGAMTLSPFLDHIGPMARCVDDLTLAYQSMLDSGTAAQIPSLPREAPSRALLIEGPTPERIEPATRVALERAGLVLARSGVPVEPVSLPKSFEGMVACWETILFRDLAFNHGADRDKYGKLMSERFLKIIDDGRAISDHTYESAVATAIGYRDDLLKLLDPEAMILAPATDGTAPVFSEYTGASVLQGLWSLTGLPSLAVPCGKAADLPVGVQLIAQPAGEQLLLEAGRRFEDAAWDTYS